MAKRGTRRGFTLVEALASIVLLSVGIVSALGAISAMTASEGRARDLDRYSRLARSKFDELLTEATTASGDQTGDFEAEGARDVTWTFTLEATGVENLDAAKLVVSARNGGGTAPQATLSKLVYRAPLTTGAIQ